MVFPVPPNPIDFMNYPDSVTDSERPFIAHVVELRNRLIRIVIALAVVFVALFPFANELFYYVASPLVENLPLSSTMIAIDPAAPFIVPLKFTFVVGVFLCIPYIFYQIWGFVAPGLYNNEKRFTLPLLISSILLFYVGVVFAYFVVCPLVFRFLAMAAPEGISVATDMSRYLGFVLKMFFAFGIAFEVPIATFLVITGGLATRETLAAKRAYVIVGTFIVGMLLTPPDVISQILLAIPMWMLFELGIFFGRMIKPAPSDPVENS